MRQPDRQLLRAGVSRDVARIGPGENETGGESTESPPRAVAGTVAVAVAGGGPPVTITHYSDAQCPCSARVPQDTKQGFLHNPGFLNLAAQ